MRGWHPCFLFHLVKFADRSRYRRSIIYLDIKNILKRDLLEDDIDPETFADIAVDSDACLTIMCTKLTLLKKSLSLRQKRREWIGR